MKKISIWAKQNPWKARITIIFSHILLFLLAWFTGTQLYAIGKELPAFFMFLFVLIYLIAAFTYPSKKNKSGTNIPFLYLKQKSSDLLLAAATFGMVVCLAADNENVFRFYTTSFANLTSVSIKGKEKSTANEILASLKYRDKSTLTRSEKKILRQEFKKELKLYTIAKLSGKKDEAGNAGLIILAIIAALGLLYVLAALSCSISCSGSEGAAVLVVVLGTAAIVVGLIVVIRAIKRGSKKKQITENVGA